MSSDFTTDGLFEEFCNAVAQFKADRTALHDLATDLDDPKSTCVLPIEVGDIADIAEAMKRVPRGVKVQVYDQDTDEDILGQVVHRRALWEMFGATQVEQLKHSTSRLYRKILEIRGRGNGTPTPALDDLARMLEKDEPMSDLPNADHFRATIDEAVKVLTAVSTGATATASAEKIDEEEVAGLNGNMKDILLAMLEMGAVDAFHLKMPKNIVTRFGRETGEEVGFRHDFAELKRLGYLLPKNRKHGCYLSGVGRKAAELLLKNKVRS